MPRRILQPDNELFEANESRNRSAADLGVDLSKPVRSITLEKAENSPTHQPRNQSNDSLSVSAPPGKKARLSPGPSFVGKNDIHSIRVLDTRNTALVDGVWQSDGSQHASKDQMMPDLGTRPSVRVAARKGMRTLLVAYFFSGLHRKASIADHLRTMCRKAGFGLNFWEIDILVGG